MSAVKGAPKKRRLSDLYVVGKSFEISDGHGAPVELYIRRPNPFEHEEALRDGNAARAKISLKMRDPKTDEHEILEADLANLGNVYQQIKFLTQEKEAELYARAYGEVAATDKWAVDSLIESIQENIDTWNALDPAIGDGHEDWEDYQRALESVEEFNKEVEHKVEDLKAEYAHTLSEDPEEDVKDQCRKILIDKAAGLAFFRDYRLACIHYGTKEPSDHSQRYFSTKQELKELPYEVQVELLKAYDEIDMARDEIKNSPSAAPSSSGSAPSVVEETSEPSGPETVSELKT